ncbi:MAG: adenylate/guanylate cyclase domain-containing protein [Acidimicrobiia bacterium]|nr:adenylate/guanylate cyclase domain-containing protein [Acidimicrobiia bacterium]
MNLATETGAEAGAIALDVQRMAPIEALLGEGRFEAIQTRAFGAFVLIGSLVAVIGVAIPVSPIPGFHPNAVATLMGVSLVAGAVMMLRPQWFPPFAVKTVVLLGAIAIVIVNRLLGPHIEVGVAPIVLTGAFCPVWFRRRWALLPIGAMAIGYAVVVATSHGYPGPANRGIAVIGTTLVGAAFLDWLIGLVRKLATQERTTHRELEVTHAQLQEAHLQLADLNQTLEARVAAQVAEIEALNRLRRFLSPQVAEAVLTAGDEAILQPHRRQIAVFFVDLRGFTTFTSGAEPEEVVEALDAYYKVVGDVLRRYEATVGTFAGDGIMAYLNDPVPCEDAPDKAVEMALSLREPMANFLTEWKRRGFDLGYGVGIAYGYATLGTIGFEGRNDYTALGSVVNLASRLCGEAANGQVLVDSRTAGALARPVEVVDRQVVLKGFPSPVRAHEVLSANPR